MNTKILNECTQGSLDGLLKFPQVVQKLSEIGVERYYADLVRMEKIYYMKNGETYITRSPVQASPKINAEFNSSQVKQTIKDIQQDKLSYIDFLKKIMESGTTSYIVYLEGKQAVYFGRKGESYTEKFPDK